MTTYAENQTTTAGRSLFAALGIGVSIVLTALGTFWDVTGNDDHEQSDSLMQYLPVVAVILVVAALVFGLAVRTEPDKAPGTRAIVLAVVGVLSLVVFWAGLPAVLAAGSAACALAARGPDGSVTALGKTSLAISAVTLVLAVAAAFYG